MKRFLKVIFCRKIREDFWWHIKRVIVEHMYWEELHLLYYYVDTRDIDKFKRLYNELDHSNFVDYLGPELSRAETLLSFLQGDD